MICSRYFAIVPVSLPAMKFLIESLNLSKSLSSNLLRIASTRQNRTDLSRSSQEKPTNTVGIRVGIRTLLGMGHPPLQQLRSGPHRPEGLPLRLTLKPPRQILEPENAITGGRMTQALGGKGMWEMKYWMSVKEL